jgi:Phage integrase, N-terminal SAM-like domain
VEPRGHERAAVTLAPVVRITPPRVEALHAIDARVEHYVDNARAARTRLAYERDLHAFARWCDAHALCASPASCETLARYLTHLVEAGKKLSTAKRARIAIGLAHAEHHLPRPDHDPSIRLLERGMARTHVHRVRARDRKVNATLRLDLGGQYTNTASNGLRDLDAQCV